MPSAPRRAAIRRASKRSPTTPTGTMRSSATTKKLPVDSGAPLPRATRLLIAPTALVLVSATAACNGDGGDGVPVDEYASGLCTAIGEWQQQIQELAQGIQENPPADPATGRD